MLIAFLISMVLLSLLLFAGGRLLGRRQPRLQTLLASFFGHVVAGNVVYAIATRNPGEWDYTWLVTVLATIITIGILVGLELMSRPRH